MLTKISIIVAMILWCPFIHWPQRALKDNVCEPLELDCHNTRQTCELFAGGKLQSGLNLNPIFFHHRGNNYSEEPYFYKEAPGRLFIAISFFLDGRIGTNYRNDFNYESDNYNSSNKINKLETPQKRLQRISEKDKVV